MESYTTKINRGWKVKDVVLQLEFEIPRQQFDFFIWEAFSESWKNQHLERKREVVHI